jgi:hypothetical protein
MKVLFLDIDGVLNSTGSCLAKTGSKWEPTNGSIMELSEWTEELLRMIGGEFGYGQVASFQMVDPTAVELINRLFQKDAELRLVLSSSHRSFFSGSNYNTPLEFGSEEHLTALRLYLKILGLESDRLIGVTGRLWTTRGAEVKLWLDEHPEVERHLAVDDGADFLPHQCVHLLIDSRLGFTGANYFAAAQLLNITESGIIA